MPVCERCDGRHFGDEPVSLLAASRAVENLLGFRIEGRKRPDGPDEHSHRMGVIVEAVDYLLDVFMDERVVSNVPDPLLQLRFGRQLSMKDQVGHLDIAAAFRKLFYRVAAIAEYAAVSIDKRNPADAGRGVHERRIVGHQPEVVRRRLYLPQIHRSYGSKLDWNLVLVAGPIVGNGQGVFDGHSPSTQASESPIFEN